MTIRRTEPRRGVVLIAVLLVVTLLALAAYQYSESMMSEYKAVDSAARAAQARLYAASGVHFAAAVLSNADSYAGTLNGNPFDNPGVFQAVPVNEDAAARYAGYFSIVTPYTVDETTDGATTQFRYGVTDESAKLNPNALLQIDPTGARLREMLLKLPNMTEDIADAIVDWIDPDDEPRTAGAESTYYTALAPGYRCKNGPLDSVEELLFVRGVTPDLLFGSDRNRNGTTDAGEQTEGEANDRGWSQYLTVYSRERNIDADGQPRIYLNDSDVLGLYDKMLAAGIPTDVADFILAFKLYGQYTPQSSSGSGQSGQGGQGGSQNQTVVINSSSPVTRAQLDTTKRGQSVSTIMGLVSAQVGISRTESTVTQSVTTVSTDRGEMVIRKSQPQTSTRTTTTVYTSPLKDTARAKQALPILLDKFTTRRDAEIPARVNVNTAPSAVLASLPGLEETDVDAILQKRPTYGQAEGSDGTFQSISWLYTEANLTPAKVAALERYVTAKPTVFRVQSIGYFEKGGPAARVEAVVDTNAGQPRIVYWRNISELGKGFNLQGQ